jgi:hypothetical protein
MCYYLFVSVCLYLFNGRELVKRSALFRILLYSEHADVTGAFGLLDRFIVFLGICFMLFGLLCLALFVPIFLVFVCYAVLYPIIQSCVYLTSSNSSIGGEQVSMLAYTLSIIYISLLFLLCLLAPRVYSFQSLRIDIMEIKNFPGIFYELPTLRELHKRYLYILINTTIHQYLYVTTLYLLPPLITYLRLFRLHCGV